MRLKPFIPEYLPAVGEVDAFLKPPRPDRLQETLGIFRLDEPCLNMKQKSYLDLLIKEILKSKNLDTEKEVFSIQSAHKNPKQIQSWIKSVEEIQSKKVAPSVFYQKRMPEIDQLMQPWDSSFDKLVRTATFKDPSVPIRIELLS